MAPRFDDLCPATAESKRDAIAFLMAAGPREAADDDGSEGYDLRPHSNPYRALEHVFKRRDYDAVRRVALLTDGVPELRPGGTDTRAYVAGVSGMEFGPTDLRAEILEAVKVWRRSHPVAVTVLGYACTRASLAWMQALAELCGSGSQAVQKGVLLDAPPTDGTSDPLPGTLSSP